MVRTIVKKREVDDYGSGEYGASRGAREHMGVDYSVHILSPVAGQVTLLGYPYAGDLSYRYVQITDGAGLHHRVMYVRPSVSVGELVTPDSIIGQPQDISKRYTVKGHMNNHVHYEVFKYEHGEKVYLNPEHL